ncbi:16S rRNA (guanine(527)-N(7))-methyltransferase RsmG [Paracoccus suum]|uniref:Ribosomal RNA small subunit methyltransferase G n=1 Tax=Paracoccus suum TaxID=2259340 RepID=A0A344PHS6_9RHOB|nr:16S rRNA (guanine(527)-N(7))-methyltransferase RsmG [Paracoccus suum]AXC48931.1 16S rRNA (guanine(527)-N(7))-methyltransferase RsmG [Paracoccus suum]
MNVSRETSKRLQAYLELLKNWSAKINLVAPATIEDAWERHIEDSLQLLDLRPSPGPIWTDLGTGGGLPGLVIAMALPSQETETVLVESDQRKAAFLRHVIRTLEIQQTRVIAERIEVISGLGASTLTARALAPLPKLMTYVERHLGPSGTALLPKGRNWREEVAAAQLSWQFELTAHPSKTQPEAAVLEIRDIHAR